MVTAGAVAKAARKASPRGPAPGGPLSAVAAAAPAGASAPRRRLARRADERISALALSFLARCVDANGAFPVSA